MLTADSPFQHLFRSHTCIMVRAPTCPICDRELLPSSITESPVFPFCSVRCKQIDLLRWCNGQYSVVDPLTPEELSEQIESRSAAEDVDDGG